MCASGCGASERTSPRSMHRQEESHYRTLFRIAFARCWSLSLKDMWWLLRKCEIICSGAIWNKAGSLINIATSGGNRRRLVP